LVVITSQIACAPFVNLTGADTPTSADAHGAAVTAAITPRTVDAICADIGAVSTPRIVDVKNAVRGADPCPPRLQLRPVEQFQQSGCASIFDNFRALNAPQRYDSPGSARLRAKSTLPMNVSRAHCFTGAGGLIPLAPEVRPSTVLYWRWSSYGSRSSWCASRRGHLARRHLRGLLRS
jgi:hypothetical protein